MSLPVPLHSRSRSTKFTIVVKPEASLLDEMMHDVVKSDPVMN